MTDKSLDDDDIIPRPESDPRDFVPTLAKPMPTYQCTHIRKNGERCSNYANRGSIPETALCAYHGGSHPQKIEAQEERMAAVRFQLLQNSDLAVKVLEDILNNANTSDAVRLKAATELLDRTVGKAPIELNVTHKEENPAEAVKRQLAKLLEGDKDDDIIDAEVVEDDES